MVLDGSKNIAGLGTITAAGLDISGAVDVDGTTNLDQVDIDGTVNMALTALVTGVLTTTAATVFNGGFASNAASTITTADNTDTLSLISTDADAVEGPHLRLFRNSGSPADNDNVGRIRFDALNDADESVTTFMINNYISDVSDGTEDSTTEIYQMLGGSLRKTFNIKPSELVINDDSQDVDFRVESNGNANMIFVDGGSDHVNIGTATDLGGVLNVEGSFITRAGTIPQATLSSSSNAVAWDALAKPNAQHTTSENTTIGAPSNGVSGQYISILIIFGGAHTIGWNTVFEFADSTEPTETSVNNKADLHIFRYNGTMWHEVGRNQNMAIS